jgi:serine/threonine protein kinase
MAVNDGRRDINPANLFVTRGPDGSSLTKVLDFATAKAASIDLGPPPTSAFAVVGTPLFMAPEQMRATQPLDVRADICAPTRSFAIDSLPVDVSRNRRASRSSSWRRWFGIRIRPTCTHSRHCSCALPWTVTASM